MREYHKFTNPLANSGDTGPMLDTTESNSVHVLNVPLMKKTKEKLKYWRSLVIMTKLQLVLAGMMILFESITDGVLTGASRPIMHFYPGTCAIGTGIWVGVLGVIAAGLGLGAFKSPYGNKCLIVAHFVMGIISTVADGILIIMVGPCLAYMSYRAHYYEPYYPSGITPGPDDIERNKWERNIMKGVLANESLLIIVGSVHFIISIVSSAFICRNWCRSSEPSVAVVYLPSGAVGGHDGNETGSCRVQVPASTKMIFVPNENAQQQTKVKQEMAS